MSALTQHTFFYAIILQFNSPDFSKREIVMPQIETSLTSTSYKERATHFHTYKAAHLRQTPASTGIEWQIHH